MSRSCPTGSVDLPTPPSHRSPFFCFVCEKSKTVDRQQAKGGVWKKNERERVCSEAPRGGQRNSDNAEPDQLDDGMARAWFFPSLLLSLLQLGRKKRQRLLSIRSHRLGAPSSILSQRHPERMFFPFHQPSAPGISRSFSLSLSRWDNALAQRR